MAMSVADNREITPESIAALQKKYNFQLIVK